MFPETSDLLLEIGVEELPASFVEAALRALPELAKKRFTELRLAHGAVHAYGTPRRLTHDAAGNGLTPRRHDPISTAGRCRA